MMRLIDSHCHMQDERFDGILEEVMRRAAGAGVTGMVCCGTSEQDWERVAALSERYDCIAPAFGLHPWFVDTRSAGWLKRLEAFVAADCCCVGEIGLDFMLAQRDDKAQIEVFEAQLRLAARYEKPVSIHCRKAWRVLIDLLKAAGGLPFGGLIHSFSGSREIAAELETLGASISFSGSVTRPNNKKAREAAGGVSVEKLLVETDSPDLLPFGAPEGLNEPANIHGVVAALAELRQVSFEEMAKITSRNAKNLFKIL